ncbi:uncharacterized protein LOC125939958 [Dermacentor silvarum]|uniref:uncharacterized protein LOC125939958 n=1 Tax=Dermacentor silvarum TaxID=543639 RepID=UPI002101AC9D|nr:uncharacterized protein LOC125939958 [Dermacentor silvarum]
MASRRRNYCFAPGCRTGYSRVKDAPKASLFSVPRDEGRRKEWERNLHRADKTLDEYCAVCELHFEPRFIIRDFVHLIDGKEVRIPREKPLLSGNAVPTILPNLPQYLTKTTPKPRNKRKRYESNKATAKKTSRRALDNNHSEFSPAAAGASEIDYDSAQEEGVTAERQHCLSFLFDLRTPSKYWSSHQLPDLDGVLYCTSTNLEEGVVTSDKVVVFLCDRQPDVYCKVYMRGRLIKELSLKSQEQAENVLKSVEATELCVGALNAKDYDACFLTPGLRKQLKIRHESYFNANCSAKVTAKAFGFSKKVLEELKQKTQDMDPFKKHGGLLVDELKLSEHLSVKQSGQIEGRINRIICVMISRFPGEALRPNSSSTEALSGFLEYLAAWEKHAGGAEGFLSESTATGLRFSEDCKIRECGSMCSKCLAGYASEQHQLPSQQQLVGSG